MAERLTFADFVFNRTDRILERGGQRIALAPKAADALALLLAEPGALVTKEAMRDALWPQGFVEDGNLTQTIHVLRRTLDPNGDGRTFIDTLPRRGYRFVASLTPATNQLSVDVAPALPARRRAPFWSVAVAAAFAVFALVIGPSAAHRTAGAVAPLTGEAARAYALGRHYWDLRPGGLAPSIREFRRVVALAPASPLGYAGLADAYFMASDYDVPAIATGKRAWTIAEKFARRALANDPRSAEALTTLGALALDRNGDIAGARRLLDQALALRPDYATAHEFSGLAQLYTGNVSGALAHLRRASELDPTSAPILNWYGAALYYGARYDDARAVLRDALGLAPGRTDLRYQLVLVDEQLARVDEARAQIREIARDPNKLADSRVLSALIDLRAHVKPAAAIAAGRTAKGAEPLTLAALDVALGRRDDALRRIGAALHDPDEHLKRGMLALDPHFVALRNDPRFRSLTSG